MEQPEHQVLRFISWNTRGIKFTKDKTPKLPLVMEELNAQKADVAFLQETHIGPRCYKTLKNIKGWKSFFTIYNPRSKGVAILISNKIEFQYICHDEDYSGGYIVLFCQLYGKLFTLVNVYNHQADKSMLPRLKYYLTAINTKGVLVVGGDFNTVLNPVFDRKSLAGKTYQSSLRGILEDFTNSLNLTDMFANTHPMDEGFTRSETDSHSRLDMFFMPTNTEDYIINCENVKAKQKRISDHDPLILDIRVTSSSDYERPEVASMLSDFKYNRKLKSIKTCKINGAEILSSIRSLSDSNQPSPDKLRVCDYKKNDLPMTEILKISYNTMLHKRNMKRVHKCFTNSLLDATSNEHCFNVDYLILTQILAKRLKVFLTSSFRSRKRVTHGVCLLVTVTKGQKIKMSFLRDSLLSLKYIYLDFTILKRLLPNASSSNDDYRILRQSCPLTRPILTLALKQLEKKIMASNKTQYTTCCHFRQSLMIWTDNQNIDKVVMLLEKFQKYSGIIYEISFK